MDNIGFNNYHATHTELDRHGAEDLHQLELATNRTLVCSPWFRLFSTQLLPHVFVNSKLRRGLRGLCFLRHILFVLFINTRHPIRDPRYVVQLLAHILVKKIKVRRILSQWVRQKSEHTPLSLMKPKFVLVIVFASQPLIYKISSCSYRDQPMLQIVG